MTKILIMYIMSIVDLYRYIILFAQLQVNGMNIYFLKSAFYYFDINYKKTTLAMYLSLIDKLENQKTYLLQLCTLCT